MSTAIVILAAGRGTRMHSVEPKVLQKLGGKYLLSHVLDTVSDLQCVCPPIVVIGYQSNKVQEAFSTRNIQWVEQKEQKGTGHALMQAMPFLESVENVLILYGDVPLISATTLQRFLKEVPKEMLGLITTHLSDPSGYGRIKRKNNKIVAIIEEKDANEEEKAIQEASSGIYIVPAKDLRRWLPMLPKNNAAEEYYLTDIISFAVKEDKNIIAFQPEESEEIFGVNTPMQLANLERFYQRARARKYLEHGVFLADPDRLDIRGDVDIAKGVWIDINVILEGNVKIGQGCKIGAHSIIKNSELKENVKVRPFSLIEGATIGAESVIGPYARIRPETYIAEQVHIGNFVEIKKSVIQSHTKINHLSYIGDSELGQRVNVGAGTITCNYDGANKHRTQIGDDVHIGSDCQLIAPIIVGEGATIGAGSTVRQDVPPHTLTLTHRLEQRSTQRWKRPKKKGKDEK